MILICYLLVVCPVAGSLNFNRSRSGPTIQLYFLGSDPVPNVSSYRDLAVMSPLGFTLM